MAISGNQWQSVAISGNQWQSVAIRQSFEEGKRRLRERRLRHYLYPRWPPEPTSEGHRKSTVTSDVTNGGPPASEDAVLGAELARLALRMELAMCPMAWLYALLPQQSNGSRRSPV